MSHSELSKKPASVSIQIDPIAPKTPKVHGDTNQETRKAAVQLNIVEDDENVTSEPCCAQNQTKYPNLFQILKWIWKILKWIGYLIRLLGNLMGVILALFYILFAICVFFVAAWMSGSVLYWIVAFGWLAVNVVAVIGFFGEMKEEEKQMKKIKHEPTYKP